MTTALAWLLLGGCREACEPPAAKGGTDAERAAVDDEAMRFQEVFRDPICVANIRIAPVDDTTTGRYQPTWRRIRVAGDRPLEDLRRTVRHELCHAAQFQLDVPLDGPTWTLGFPLDIPTDRVPGESFAYTCQLGPELAYLAGDPCPTDTPGTEAFPFLTDYFVRPEGLVDRRITWSPRGSVMLEAAPTRLDVRVTAAGNLRLSLDDGEITVDPYGAGLVDDPTDAAPAPAIDGGPRLLSLVVLAANGGTGLRRVYEDALGQSPAGCLASLERAFLFDGEIWSASVDGRRLQWGAWAPHER